MLDGAEGPGRPFLQFYLLSIPVSMWPAWTSHRLLLVGVIPMSSDLAYWLNPREKETWGGVGQKQVQLHVAMVHHSQPSTGCQNEHRRIRERTEKWIDRHWLTEPLPHCAQLPRPAVELSFATCHLQQTHCVCAQDTIHSRPIDCPRVSQMCFSQGSIEWISSLYFIYYCCVCGHIYHGMHKEILLPSWILRVKLGWNLYPLSHPANPRMRFLTNKKWDSILSLCRVSLRSITHCLLVLFLKSFYPPPLAVSDSTNCKLARHLPSLFRIKFFDSFM